MANRSWSNIQGGDWFQASNWDTTTVPGANDDVFINLSGSYTVTLNATTASINSLTINDADAILSLTTTGALNITGNGGTDQLSLTNGDVQITGGAAITATTIVFGGSSGILEGSGTVTGTLSGSGGIVQADDAGTLVLKSDIAASTGLDFEIGGNTDVSTLQLDG